MKYKLKKNIYDWVKNYNGKNHSENLIGGAKLNLYDVEDLVNRFKSIDKAKISAKIAELNTSIENLNKELSKAKVNTPIVKGLNIEEVINDASTLVTKLSSGSLKQENINIQMPVHIDPAKYSKTNLDNINTIERKKYNS